MIDAARSFCFSYSMTQVGGGYRNGFITQAY
jgi:hypothetical protein